MKRSLMSLLVCIAAQAAIVPSVSLEELIDQSQTIVHGRVMRSWSTSAWPTAPSWSPASPAVKWMELE